MAGKENSKPDYLISENPATLEVNDEIQVVKPEEVEETVKLAKDAQKEWGKKTPEERLKILREFKRILLNRKQDISKIISKETGKPRPEAILTDITPVLDAVRYMEEEGESVLEEKLDLGFPELAKRRSKIIRQPLGVIGLITPWNYPFGIPGSEIVSALFAGNSVVLKPAEQTSLTGLKLEELLLESGVPENVINVVPGWGETTGKALVESEIDHISFTGSTKVGGIIEKIAFSENKSVHLELGGSDPAIVLEDADLELATDGILWGRFVNAGQTCAAIKRVFVEKPIYEDFKELFLEKVETLRVGYGNESKYDMGPLIDEKGLEKIKNQVENSVEKGAEVLTGGSEIQNKEGYFYEPTVLENVDQNMPVMNEETFGPALPIKKVEDEVEAVNRANNTEYGLTASIWTRNQKYGKKLARKVEAGTVMINEHAYTYGLHATPWGGVKNSGEGRSHGKWGIDNVTETKHIHTSKGNTPPQGKRLTDPWWFPYSDDFEEMVSDGLDVFYGTGIRNKLKKVTSLVRRFIKKRKDSKK